MAIDNMQGKVSTTGAVNQKPNVPNAPDLSAIPAAKLESKLMPAKQPVSTESPEATPMELEFAERAKKLTDEDQVVIQSILSPSVRKALEKIIPEFKPVMDAYGSNEPNIIIPLSIASNFAMRKYGGNNEQEAVNNFMTEVLSGTEPMETQQATVPPSQPSEQPGLMTSPQNMEQV
jgi:hypothetical protein